MDRTGAGDPARTLRLLWRDTRTPARGPKPGLTVDDVVTAAIALADADGLAAVTMRALARSLGVAPMSLYTYVPGKAELIDLMLDAVYARMPRADLAGLPWRARVTAVATANRDLFRRHPWAATVSTSRPPLGPGQMAKYEHELSAFAGLGLSDPDTDAALTFVLGFVTAAARAEAEFTAATTDSGLTDEQWWESAQPYLARVFDPAVYPAAARIGAAAGAAHGAAYDPDHAYDFGLRRVLDGLAALVSPDGVADPRPDSD